MSELLRSKDMSYVRILLPKDAILPFTDLIAAESCAQFTDLNESLQSFQRKHVSQIIQINESLSLLNEIEECIKNYTPERYEEIYSSFYTLSTENELSFPVLQDDKIIALKSTIELYHTRLMNDVEMGKTFEKEIAQYTEFGQVLVAFEAFLGDRNSLSDVLPENVEELVEFSSDRNSDLEAPFLAASNEHLAFRFIAGVVTHFQRTSFERQVFLLSRGNALCNFFDIPNEDKSIFITCYRGCYLDSKVRRLCTAMSIDVYIRPEDDIHRNEKLEMTQKRLMELIETHARTLEQLERDSLGVSEYLFEWKAQLEQSKIVYITLDYFRLNEQTKIAQMEAWIPTDQLDVVRTALDHSLELKGYSTKNDPSVFQNITHSIPADMVPPTYFPLDEFTKCFQQIVDTYGVPRYKEINPGLFTIITFPFLFGMMYGDMFHGTALFLIGIALVLWNDTASKQKNGEFVGALLSARYALLFMGFFAMYCGFVYNDCASLTTHMFGSRYTPITSTNGVFDSVYPFGVDPVWYYASNNLEFINSMKMKMSVIVGVAHMIFGLFLALLNHVYFGDYITIFCQFIPEVLFLSSLFGYMCFMIIYKWCIDWSLPGMNSPPNLITAMIDMTMMTKIEDEDLLYESQNTVQLVLLIVAGVSIPWLLLLKPVAILIRSKFVQAEDGKKVAFGDVMMHQLIHTIEYVLGTISNTASYLRLWALSLAHGQLSEVFFENLISSWWSSPVMLVVGVAAWTMVTLGVLLGMDVLECFLHALRLHWVEFQNKFYHADGKPFVPLTYKGLVDKVL